MQEIINYFAQLSAEPGTFQESEFSKIAKEFILALEQGRTRAASRDSDGNWQVNRWVKEGILFLFKYGKLTDYSVDNNFNFFDKDTIPLQKFDITRNVRIVPGGSSIRCGSYIAPGVICMPPMYINIGAYVDEGTMVDSHALVGTCAQIGRCVHISAASQIGGVLEPSGARPVIIEDDVMIGGNCGVYEGVLIRRRAVLASGVALTASSRIYDLVNNRIIKSDENNPLEVPESAVLVPGSRAISSDFGKEHGLSISTPLIVKYRDSKTDAKTALNAALR
ncbi:MAG: 2,3,4,5-tetrahydropyridine-2,6-dicarboxylate N-succinyltransferase [Ignavibacteria bacterium]|nr:2,3,4,5-tetrahydropyridine-2,6-dicarboxylate N-succinyltransferase [Ignavibacteria bacterium]